MRELFITGLFLSILPSKSLGTEYLACIDDSDCVDLGHKYACFMYMCYPWKEPDSEEHPTCISDWDCWFNTGECFRHHRVRQISKGICFRQIHSCFKHEDCPEGHACCGKHCCPLPYFEAWKEFSCYSDVGCQSLKLGPKCCPDTERCCGGENEEEFFSTLSPTILDAVDIPLTITTEEDYESLEREEEIEEGEMDDYPPILPEEHQLMSYDDSEEEEEEEDLSNQDIASLCEDYLENSSSTIAYNFVIVSIILYIVQFSKAFIA